MSLRLLFFAFFIIVVEFILLACARRPDPSETIRGAYAWYVRNSTEGIDPLRERRSHLRQFATEAFLTSLENARFGEDGGYGRGGSLVETSRVGRISIDQITKNGRTANARVTFSERQLGNYTLNVALVIEQGRWKIDDVKLVE